MNTRSPTLFSDLGNQRWNGGRDSYRPPQETIDPGRHEVVEIDEDTTPKRFVEEHHYSGSYPAARFRFGLYRSGVGLAGVAVFSTPMNDLTITNALATNDPLMGVELGRFVLLDEVEGNGESWFLTRCFRVLREKGLAGVVSFSDPLLRTDHEGDFTFGGHIGRIYQAANAHYLKRSKARTRHMLPDGTMLSPRSASKIRAGDTGWRYAVERILRFGAEEPSCYGRGEADQEELRWWLAEQIANRRLRPLRHPGNHKYAWCFRGSEGLQPNPKKYPKTVDVPGQ